MNILDMVWCVSYAHCLAEGYNPSAGSWLSLHWHLGIFKKCGQWHKYYLWAGLVGMSSCSAEIFNTMWLTFPKNSFRYKLWYSIMFSIDHWQALGPTWLHIQWILGVKMHGCEADCWPPSSAKVKNVRTIPPLSQTSSWHGA